MKVFGSKALLYVPRQIRRKLDNNAKEGIFVGYDERSRGYRILVPENDRIIISRNVKFNERKNTVDTCEHESVPVDSESEASTQNITLESSSILPSIREESVTESEETLEQPRRSARSNKGVPPDRLAYLSVRDPKEPKTWSDMLTMCEPEKTLWINAANEEMHSLEKNNTWELVDLPPGKRAINCKWIFKVKHGNDEKPRYKARLVAQGFSQRRGLDYDQTFSPVVKHATIRTVLTVAARKKMHVRHFDIKSAYLYGNLDEEIYMTQPQGYEVEGQEHKVCRLKKSIYGLKQSGRIWNHTLAELLQSQGYKQGSADQCLFICLKPESTTYLIVYVDDILVCSDAPENIENARKMLGKHFEVKDLGNVANYLGIEIERKEDGSFLLHQRKKIQGIIERYSENQLKKSYTPMATDYGKSSYNEQDNQALDNSDVYQEAVGALLYLSNVSRPDISTAVGLLGRKVQKPTVKDWKALQKVIHYLQATLNHKLRLDAKNDLELSAYVDADFAGDTLDRKSTTGFLIKLGNNVISWGSKKQSCIALSTTEAEYVAVSYACQEVIWLRELMSDLNFPQTKPTLLREDNQACISLIQNEKAHTRMKHLDVKLHFIRNLHPKVIKAEYCESKKMIADALTKPLPRGTFESHRTSMGLAPD